jgi:hypothetical protein
MTSMSTEKTMNPFRMARISLFALAVHPGRALQMPFRAIQEVEL